mmetsp:Transcript_25731/g.28057  ORF Transcript_25731/g.28057 Transcript_25731/m.28057 type:complete len:115 (+) Transcript_25731:3-347(+)|eukprot:gene7269-7844_t
MKITREQLLVDFRRILRHFSKLPSYKAKESPLRAYVLQQYVTGRKETNPHRAESLRSIAHSYASMVTDVRELKYLRYLDSGEKLDQRDKIRRTAARVGLAVPHFSDESSSAVSQ